jgi:hypothetical protein
MAHRIPYHVVAAINAPTGAQAHRTLSNHRSEVVLVEPLTPRKGYILNHQER